MNPELDTLIDRCAQALHARRLGLPALLMLGALKPLPSLTNAGLQLALPWLDAFVSTDPLREMIARPDGAALLCAALADRLDILARS